MPQLLDHVGRGITATRSTSVRTEGHDQGSFLVEKKGNRKKPTLRIRKDDQEPAGGQGMTVAVFENHTRGHLISVMREDFLQQSTPKGSGYLGFGKHGAKTCQEVVKMDHVGSIKWRISNLTGNLRDSRRG